jgi:predicted dehydrogenase
LGIGIIGLGNITHHHLMAYQAREPRVEGGAEPDEERRRRAREMFGIPMFADCREILDQPACRIVDATVPHQMEPREPIVHDAPDRGKALFVQEPLMPHLADAGRLVEIAEAKGVPLMVNQNSLFVWMTPGLRARGR